MTKLLDRIARFTVTRKLRSLLIGLAFIVLLGAAVGAFGGELADDWKIPGAESDKAYTLLQDKFPAASGADASVVFTAENGKITDAQNAAVVQEVLAGAMEQPGVIAAPDPFGPEAAGQVSADGRIAYTTVVWEKSPDDLLLSEATAFRDYIEEASTDTVEVSARGTVIDYSEEMDMPIGEIIGIFIAIIILTLIFRSFLATGVTLLSALLSIAIGFMFLTLSAGALTISTVAPTVAMMLGLGVGIDYALLSVSRYREHLAAGESAEESVAAANRTAGASVLAAGAIVALAISGLLAVGIPFVGSMGYGAGIVVAAVAIGAVTILPWFMGLAARRLTPKDPKVAAPSKAMIRWSTFITRRPWVSLILGLVVLILMAVPFLDMRLGTPDDGNDPVGSISRTAYDRLAEGFGPGFNGPLLLVADTTGATGNAEESLNELTATVMEADGVAFAAPPTFNEEKDTAIISVIPTSSPQAEETSDLVYELRDNVIPPAVEGSGLDVMVGGNTAIFEDMTAKISERLPVFIAVVVGLSILLLMAAFRSIWVPLVSALFNLISITAAYGLVVAVFQWGWGGTLLGVSSGIPIISFLPMFMFAILFGLSMDYNVFLQSRFREEAMHGADGRHSVVMGMARVGKVILAAGTIMAGVFLGFATHNDVMIKMMGVGLASAIAIDVLLVRMVVVPAAMSLMGPRAWSLPPFLDRILPHVELEVEEETGEHLVVEFDDEKPAEHGDR